MPLVMICSIPICKTPFFKCLACLNMSKHHIEGLVVVTCFLYSGWSLTKCFVNTFIDNFFFMLLQMVDEMHCMHVYDARVLECIDPDLNFI